MGQKAESPSDSNLSIYIDPGISRPWSLWATEFYEQKKCPVKTLKFDSDAPQIDEAAILLLSAEGFEAWKEKNLDSQSQRPVLVWIGNLGGMNQLRQLMSSGLGDFFVPSQVHEEEFKLILSRAHALVQEQIGERKLWIDVKNQNRKLMELKHNLEGLVRDRTLTEEHAKKRLEEKVSETKDLVRFVKDLSFSTVMEELVFLLRKEVRRFHKMGDLVLCLRSPGIAAMHVYFRNTQFVERPAKSIWDESHRIRINEPLDSQYLADEFGRPFGKVIAVPLLSDKTNARRDQSSATVFFENDFLKTDADQFLDKISERLQATSIALDRILLEQDLRRTSYLWEQTFDGLRDPIAIISADFELIRSNRIFSESHEGETCHQRFAQIDSLCLGCPLNDSSEAHSARVSQVHRGGRVFTVQSYPIRGGREDERPTFVNHYHDVTDSFELQSRMIQTEKMAALGHLAGHIAHELNNPLTGIRSLAQVFRMGEEVGSQFQKDIAEVESSAARCQAIIQNLLQFTQGEGKSKRVEMNELVQSTLPFLKTALGEHSVEVELCDQSLEIEVEPNLLQQVIFNLINNACQAMKKNGELWIKTEYVKRDGLEFGRLSIQDSGPGVPKSLKERVFEPFFTTKTEGEGTGLGLSLSRQILRKYGGEVWIEDSDKPGSLFVVELPLRTSK